MKTSLSRFALSASVLLLAQAAATQVPDGWYVYGAFNPSKGRIGVFASHPRTPGSPIAITNLQGDLTVTGSSCILYRKRDGAILVGERSPTNASVDLHVLTLKGFSVFIDQSFSLGTGGPCCGEVPQMGLLGDDRVVVAVTDVSAGPLKNIQTTSYGWQGIGIVDTGSGLVTPITITNGSKIVDVFNGLAVAPDEKSVLVGTYVSSTQGDIWQVPIAGGAATLVTSVPAGLSNMAFDKNGDLWVTTLDAKNALFRVELATKKVTQVMQTNGSLNAIEQELTTGNFAVLSATKGNPVNSVFWMEPNGTDHLLSNPGYGILSGVAINPNPEVFGEGTAGPSAGYRFEMPNPGGLPLLGNSAFSLTLLADGFARPGVAVFAFGQLDEPLTVYGAKLFLDPSKILLTAGISFHPTRMTIPLPIPNATQLVGVSLFLQTFHVETNTLASSPAVRFSAM